MQPLNYQTMSTRPSLRTPSSYPAIQLALLVQTLLFLSAAAHAATPDIVGTWRKSDQSFVEFRNDGTVAAGTNPVGKWERLRDSTKYVLRFNGASFRDFYYVTTGKYQRQLTLELPSIGTRTHLDRVDNGPTVNPDAPNERKAKELEFNDLVQSIERTREAHSRALAEAAEAWERHYHARAIGRISGWIPVARQKEAAAKGLEGSLNHQRESLKKLAATLGKPIPQEATPPTIASATPSADPQAASSSGPLSTRSSHRVVSRVRSNQTPTITGPTFVPGSPGVMIPQNPGFVPGQPMHIHRNPMTGQLIFTP
jgi:hypothetical protein